jgi:hypothetical protein
MFTSFSHASWATQYPNSDATWSLPKKMQSWTLNDTYTLSPSMLNNVILGVKRLDISVNNTYDASTASLTASAIGCGCVGDVAAPDVQQIWFPRAMGMGIWNGYIDMMTQNSVYVADNFSVNKGRHSIKMGVEIRQYHEVKYQTWGAGAGISYNDSNVNVGGSGNGIADMLLGRAASFYQNNTQILDIHYPAREAYVQDTIKVTPRFTATIGARWEPHFGIHPTDGNFVTFRAGQSSTIFPTAPVGLVTIGDQGVPSNLYGVRWGKIAPRASFAWDVLGNGRMAVRAGYGQFSDYQVLIGFNGYTNTAPYGVNYSPSTETLNLANPYAEYGSVPFPYKSPMAGDPANSSLVFANPLNTQAMSRDYTSGAIHQWNVMVDFEPIRTYLFSVGYVATRGTHLSESHDTNWPQFVAGLSTSDTENVRSRRPYFAQGFETITMESSDYNSMYNSLQARLTKRYSRGLTFMGHYTLSSSKAQNGCRYLGDCSLDYYSPGQMHRGAAAFSYDLPIPQGHSRVSKMLLGGWTLGGTFTATSGEYASVSDYNCDEFNYGSASCYATYTGSSPYSSSKGSAVISGGTQVGVSWLNTASFARANETLADGKVTTLPGLGKRLFLGNAIAGTYQGPSLFMLNGSLTKAFAFTERLKASYRVEAMNALNHTVLTLPASTTVQTDMSQFGVITTARDPRQIQMSLRFIF